MLGVRLLPRQVDDRADLLAAAEQDGVARAMPVLARVELHEVGVGLGRLADEHRDAQHRRRRVEQRLGPARALLREDEPDEVGSGRDGRVDVLLPGQAAHLHERPGEQPRELGSRVRRAHQRRSDQDGAGAAQLRGGRLRARLDAALRDHDAVARRARDQCELRVAVDREVPEVPGVDADDRCVELRRAVELVGVVRLDERVEPEPCGFVEQCGARGVVEIAEQEQHGVGARRTRFLEVLARAEEALREQRQSRGGARRAQVVERACEALVDQHRHRPRARGLVRARDGGRIAVRPQVARRRETGA